MSGPATALYRLFAQADGAQAIRAVLADYATAKAIFTGALPDDAPLPCILIAEVGGQEFGCRDQRGAEVQVDASASHLIRPILALVGGQVNARLLPLLHSCHRSGQFLPPRDVVFFFSISCCGVASLSGNCREIAPFVPRPFTLG